MLLVLPGLGAIVARAQSLSATVGVYYVGQEDVVAAAIRQAAPYLVVVDQPDLAQVLVINDAALTPEAAALSRKVQQGDVGLVVFCGPQFPQNIEELSVLLGVSAFGIARQDRSAPVQEGVETDPLQRAIAWSSAPAIRSRTVISNPNLLLPIVTTRAGEPVLQRLRGRTQTQVFLVGGWLGAPDNAAWPAWPYFRYLVYRLIAEAADAPRVRSFANYPNAPVLQGRARRSLLGGSVVLLGLTVGAFYLARRRLFLEPHVLDALAVRPTSSEAAWESVGFHRPLVGFLILFSVGLLLLGVLVGYRSYIVPHVLLPWRQVQRFRDQVLSWLEIVWLLFDMGVGIAVIRYVATLLARHPQRAFRYLQFYVWWRLVGGAVQLSLVAGFTAIFLPTSPWAHLTFYLVAYTLLQVPGFLSVFRLFFRATQQFHREQVLTVIELLGPVALQSVGIVLMRRWGATHPGVGEALGGVLGLALGLYLSRWLVFGVGLLRYRRAGYSMAALLLPGFDARVVARALGFGGRITLGALAVPLGAMVQLPLVAAALPQLDRLQQPWAAMTVVALAYELVALGLYPALLPAIAEAFDRGYPSLLRYYVSQGLRYGIGVGVFLLAVLSAVGEDVVVGFWGTPYRLVGRWLLPMAMAWSALRGVQGALDWVLMAVDRPALASWLTLGEHLLRTGLIVGLLPRWGWPGLLVAYLAPLLLRLGMAWLSIQRQAGHVRVYLWQTFIAPAGAGYLLYRLLTWMGDVGQVATPLAGGLLLTGALTLTLPLFGFLTALLGGWDKGGIAELRRATAMSGVVAPLVGVFTLSVRLGALSPLHGRFPMALREPAEEEARALTMSRYA